MNFKKTTTCMGMVLKVFLDDQEIDLNPREGERDDIGMSDINKIIINRALEMRRNKVLNHSPGRMTPMSRSDESKRLELIIEDCKKIVGRLEGLGNG